MRRTKWLLMVLLFPALLMAQSTDIAFEEYKLENGLHVILHEDHTAPNVIVSVMYHVGAKNEQPEKTGFAHFFEHLMFEGSKNIERGMYSKYVEQAGGMLNANTSWDRTFYYELLPSNQLELGLWLESERMLHLKVDPLGIKTQKGVVVEEIKETTENQPYGTLLSETFGRAFVKHPYNWTVLGSKEHIQNATDQDYMDFHDQFYVPNNAVLAIGGAIDIAETKKMVETYFGDIPKGTKPIYRPDPNMEPVKNKEIRDTVFDNIQLPMVIQAYHAPAMGTDDFYAMEMLTTLLSGGQSSRLYKSLVDEQAIALQVQALPLPLEHPGLTIALALPNMGVDPKVLEEGMDQEIEKVRNELITEREFQKLQNQFENQMIQSYRTIASRVEALATNYTYYGETDRVNSEIDRYLSVSREDIQRVANTYLRKDNRVVLYYLPK